MVKNKNAKTKSKIRKKSKTSESQICRKERQIILDKLQQVMVSHINNNPNDADVICLNRTVLSCARNIAQMFPSKNSPLVETNANSLGRNDDNDACDDYRCYRCKHFIEIPRNLSLPFCKTTPAFIGQCQAELNFVQAIVWLKSAAASVSQISVQQLRQIFNRQWNTYEDALNSSVISTRSCDITPQETIHQSHSHSSLENIPSEIFASTNNPSELLEALTPERYTSDYCDTENKRKDSLSKFCIIPDSDEECSSSLSDMFQSPCVPNNVSENQNKWFPLVEDAKCLAHPISKNYIVQTNKGIVDEENVYFTEEECEDISNKSVSNESVSNETVSLGRSQSTLVLDDYSGESLTSITNQCNLIGEFSLPSRSDCNSNNFVIYDTTYDTCDIVSQINNVTVYQKSCDNSQTDQIQPTSSNAYDNDNFEFQIDDSGSNTQTNNIIEQRIENPRSDSAYSTSNTDVINYKMIAKRTAHKYMSEANTEYHLKSCKKKTKHKDITDSISIIRETRKRKRQSSFSLPEEYKSRYLKNLSKEERVNMEGTISANWLNFTLESLNVEHVIVESLKIILSMLCDERTANDYVTRRYWKNTLEKEAVNAALNVSDILIMEKKPDICAREIMMAIIESLHEIITCVRLNKTSMWIYRVQIIFELCNSLSICVGIVDHLITKLKSFHSALINARKIRQNTHAMINRLHLLFYALNIAIQKYRTIVPRDQKSRFTKNTIPHVTELWKKHYINDEFEYTRLNLNNMEMRWLNALENFTAASMENFVQFAEKSLSLFHVLAS